MPRNCSSGAAGSRPPPAPASSVVNPSNENVLAELPDVAPADVDKAVAAARAAFDDGPWPDLPVAERIARLRVFSDALLAGGAEIGLAWGAECGPTAPYRDAINGIVAPTLYDDAYAMAAGLPVQRRADRVRRAGHGGQGAVRGGGHHPHLQRPARLHRHEGAARAAERQHRDPEDAARDPPSHPVRRRRGRARRPAAGRAQRARGRRRGQPAPGRAPRASTW